MPHCLDGLADDENTIRMERITRMLTHYQNPVFDGYMADPFVLKHEGHYYAYGTASLSPKGWPFPVLHSTDLVNWQQHGWSLIPPGGDEFWAPEVVHHDGVFYMYYSARSSRDPRHDKQQIPGRRWVTL